MATIKFERDFYPKGMELKVIYTDIYRLGYHVEIKDPDEETVKACIALMGGGECTTELLPWAKFGVYSAHLYKDTGVIVSDTAIYGGETKKKVTIVSVPPGANIEVS